MKLGNHILGRVVAGMSMLFVIALLSPQAIAACNDCGTITDIKTVRIQGQASGVGAVAGGVVGGVLGNQVGGGTGKDIATIGGIAGGAYVGHQMEKKSKSRTEYQVIVQMENGSSQTFKYSSKTSYQIGDKVLVKDGKLLRP